MTEKPIIKKIVPLALASLILASAHLAEAGQAKIYRVGVILLGGNWYAVVDGLRDGLREFGLEEGKHVVLEIRDTKGDAKAANEAARNLERDKVDILYGVGGTVTIAARRATVDIPIVFVVGTDPVVLGLVDGFSKPGGRLTGVYMRVTDLAAKRLEILKEMVPKLRRVVTFYDPNNRIASDSAKLAQEAARQLKVELVERHVASVEKLRVALQGLKAGEADALLMLSDVIVTSQAQLIIDTATAKRMPTMFQERSFVFKGGLASYDVSYHGVGRLSARYVQRILTGAIPKDLPVEGIDKIELIINLKTAKQIGLTIPQWTLMKADRVIK